MKTKTKPRKITAESLTGEWKRKYDQYRFWLSGKKHKWEEANKLALAQVVKDMKKEEAKKAADNGETLF
jgi:hypothetical protein